MKYLSFIAVLFLCSCAGQGMPMTEFEQPEASPQSFHVCHGYSCLEKTTISLDEKEWAQVARAFKPAVKTAEAERVQIGEAIGKLEALTQEKGGLDPDRARAAGVKDGRDQMDCIDETANTYLYLGFLEQAELLKFHKRTDPLHRGYIINGRWPHNTAAIEELASGTVYAVDSYYRDNGEPAYVVAKRLWVDGWKPD